MASFNIKAWPAWPENNNEYKYFEEFAYNSINGPDPGDDTQYIVNGKVDIRLKILQFKDKIMVGIFNAYKMITLPAFMASLAAWLVLVVMSIPAKKWREPRYEFLCVSTLALGLFFSRLMTLVILDATTSMSAVLFYSNSNYICFNRNSRDTHQIWGCEKG